MIYLDFAKAFDSVDYNILLAKLNAYRISGNLLSRLTNYLSGRFQLVVLEGASSQWAPFTSGVPQGSLLGLLVFVIFVNDLPEAANGEVNTALYAAIQRSLVLLSAFTTAKLCRPPFQIWMNGRNITTSNLTPLNVTS